jgi:DNA-dependent RNA polymerase auxiliary subunit epsilon
MYECNEDRYPKGAKKEKQWYRALKNEWKLRMETLESVDLRLLEYDNVSNNFEVEMMYNHCKLTLIEHMDWHHQLCFHRL